MCHHGFNTDSFLKRKEIPMKTQKVKMRKAYRQGELLFMPVHPEELQALSFNPVRLSQAV